MRAADATSGQAKAERSVDAAEGGRSARAPALAFGTAPSPVPPWLAERGAADWAWRDAARPDALARPLEPAWRELLAQATQGRWQVLPAGAADRAESPASSRRLEVLQRGRVAGTLAIAGDTARWCDPRGCAAASLTPATARALLEALER